MTGEEIAKVLQYIQDEVFVSLPSQHGYHLINIERIEFCQTDTGDDCVILFPFESFTNTNPN